MTITTAMIKELRARTGAGMMDCKQALAGSDGDLERAIEELRKKGAAAVAKKAGRIAAEGIISTAHDANASVLVEINCETDFVARDDSFRAFAAAVADAVLRHNPGDVEALAAQTTADGTTVAQAQQEVTARIGEKISVRRFVRIDGDGKTVSAYLHGTRIGVLVRLDGDEAIGRDLAMHIAASRPLCIAEQDMDSEVLVKERAIYEAQAAASGKPEAIREKMVDGKIRKFIGDNTLLGQPFVKDSERTVAQLLKDTGATVLEMVRFEVGEGLESRRDDFYAEVMSQAKG